MFVIKLKGGGIILKAVGEEKEGYEIILPFKKRDGIFIPAGLIGPKHEEIEKERYLG